MSKPLENYIIRIKSSIDQFDHEGVIREEDRDHIELMTRGSFTKKNGSYYISYYTIAISKVCIRFFDAFCDSCKTKISLYMAVSVVDLFEIIHIKHDQHSSFAPHPTCLLQIAVLVQKPCKCIQLIPHLAAIDKIQYR